ncbi:branched-chain amino acid ABC transporter permease [uncultured Jatrophihabitans sp.]|uniref:branched-chain amino acid ABC transporter permease n=1 Tax=uncultured Jatrophihabitans sp. TaxID=1610747 RepID=UPI0035C94B8E
MNASANAMIKRLAACLAGGLVLALMIGPQEGTQNDLGLAFHQAIFNVRVIWFLLIGVALFLLVTFYPYVQPYFRRPGVAPMVAGVLAVLISQFVMNWLDGLSAKFGPLADKVSQTDGLSALTTAFFAWLAWTLLVLCVIAVAVAIGFRTVLHTLSLAAGIAAAVLGVVGAVLAYVAHADVVDFTINDSGPDHSFGVYADIIGFLVLAGAGITAAVSRAEVADPRAFLSRVLDYRAGLLFSALATVWGLLAFLSAGWFGAQPPTNWTLSVASDRFEGTGVGALPSAYLGWLGLTLFLVCAIGALVAAYLRIELLAWGIAVLSLVSMVLTFATLEAMTSTATREAPQYGAKWQNLGVGGWTACLVFVILLGAALQSATVARAERRAEAGALRDRAAERTGLGANIRLPFTAVVEQVRRSAASRAVLVATIGIALFYPPTLPSTWQNVLVSQIGVYLLLAVGLNVVVGWAGLLDLGYIAFYEIGAYTTAYFVGALPGAQPPSWLHWPAYAVIPVAVIACLIAGVLLGAPTLRLRGDYLAIVTLGFGEIIQVLALNNPGGLTGGSVGPTIPHPRIDIPLLHITFGQDFLPYWYALLVILVIVIVLFYRLENSRIGRAWAAIREDEIAAQASGVNTTRVKLLAFAIGASTSGLAGWFFSTQVGYFDPSLFTLQVSILIVAYVVFGGMGSLPGAMAGAAVLTWLPQFLKSQVPLEDRQMWVGALVLAMMIFRPAGLLPAKRRRAELEGLDATSSAETRAVPASEGL